MSEEKKAAVVKYHRRTLLDAADRLLSEFGYDGMNMNMLAKEAGYSKATVYVYFSSKDEIVRALAIERLTLLRREFSVIINNDAELDEKLDALALALDEFASNDKVYFDFICASVYAPPLSDRSESEIELSALIDGIVTDLSAIVAPVALKDKFYYYYGKYKVSAMFGG